MTGLPDFSYHPDPIATGSVERSETECLACGKARGFIYTGPVYAVEELVEVICPWCIADGTAAAKFDAEFTDVGWGVLDGVPTEVTEAIAKRTPGFGGCGLRHGRGSVCADRQRTVSALSASTATIPGKRPSAGPES